MVFDKTGTLTEGKLRLNSVKSFNQFKSQDVLAMAAAVESLTTHPLAAAVKQAAAAEGR